MPRKTKKETEPKKEPKLAPPPKDADNPSLIVMEGVTKLRVFEDFFCEKELPKWKEFDKRISDIQGAFGFTVHEPDDLKRLKERYMNRIMDARHSDEEKDKLNKTYEEVIPLLPELQKMFKDIHDDRYDIQGKHEREFNEKMAKMVLVDTFGATPPATEKTKQPVRIMDRIKRVFKKKEEKPKEPPKQEPEQPKIEPVSIEVSMANLKDHLIHTSTEEMVAYRLKVEEIRQKFLRAGQYEKVKTVDGAIGKIIEEQVLVDKGFDKYVEEEQMIKFLQTTERGAICNFMRYYDGIVPDDVIAKKEEVDKLKIFDNYVICYYSDPKEAAKKAEAAVTEKKVEKKRNFRRDPILFGIIKSSRKLYYICDWVTDTDDLTLEVLEKVLGEDSKKLSSSLSRIESSTLGTTLAIDSDMAAGNMRQGRMQRFMYDGLDSTDTVYYSQMNSSPTWINR